MWTGYSSRSSYSRAIGAISRSAKLRIASRKSRCSSVRERSIAIARLPPLEDGRPLLPEGLGPFHVVFGDDAERLRVGLEVELGGDVLVEPAVERLLGQTEGDGRAGGELLGQLCGRPVQLVVGHHLVHQADALGLPRVDDSAGQQQLRRPAEA